MAICVDYSGAFYGSSTNYRITENAGNIISANFIFNFQASRSNSTYSGGTVRPASYGAQYLIKY